MSVSLRCADAEDDVVFAPSLLGSKQNAALALHKCWAIEDAKERGGAPPPPMMVMIAAMLRSPTLDAVREAAAEPAAEVSEADLGNWAQLTTRAVELLAKSIASGDEDACREVVFPRFAQLTKETWDVYSVLSATVNNIVPWCVLSAVRTSTLHALGVALPRLFAICEPLWQHCPYRSSFVAQHAQLRHAAMPRIIPEILDCIANNGAGLSLDVDRLQLLLAQEVSNRKQRQASLPMGDVRCLVTNQMYFNDVVRSILEAVASSTFPTEAALSALVELHREEVAAMVFAVLGERTAAVSLLDVQRDTRAAEMRCIMARNGTDTHAQHPALLLAHGTSGLAVVRIASPASVAGCHVLLRSEQRQRPLPSVGAAAYHDLTTFHDRWRAILRGVLDGWDWSHCLAAGGAVVRALVGTDRPEDDTTFGDVDLFFYGLSYREVRERLRALEQHVRSKVGAGQYAVLLTSRTMTIVIDGAPRLQVALGMWTSATDVLMNCDVDCCGAGFDGSAVVLTGRAAAAYASRINAASATRHMVRGSIQYEMRLWKYAQRYSFAVLDALYQADDEIVKAERERLCAAYDGKSDTAAKRMAATSLTGLRWLMAVDLGLFTPAEPSCNLSVGDGITVKHVADTVTTKGYMESDNYGTHEEGYMVVCEDDNDGSILPTDGEPAPLLDVGGYLHSYEPLFRSNFANQLGLSDVDGFYAEKLQPAEWLLP